MYAQSFALISIAFYLMAHDVPLRTEASHFMVSQENVKTKEAWTETRVILVPVPNEGSRSGASDPFPRNTDYRIGIQNIPHLATYVRRARLYYVVPHGTSGHTELHALTEESGFTAFRLNLPTNLEETGPEWRFCMKGDDLVGIKTRGGAMQPDGKRHTEVHILTAASGYKAQAGYVTNLEETEGTSDRWQFGMRGDDLVGIKTRGGAMQPDGKRHTEVHILTAASGYKAQAGYVMPLGESD
jgi:hypothetical protein